MISRDVTITNAIGLHARPATFFIQKANSYKSSIWVEKEDRKVNAKSLLGVLSLGIAQGMQPIAGYNLGIGLYSRVRRVFYYAVFSAFFLTLFCWVGIQLFPEAVVRAFVKETDANSTQLIELATHGLRIMGLVFPLVGTQIIIGNFFQSIGRPIMSVFLNIMRQFLMLIPCLLLLPCWWQGDGIWRS
jgi:phosphotransferase system HPr (HPr) family protein